MKVLFTVVWGGSREQARDGGHPEMNNTLRLRGHGEESQLIAGIVQEGWLGSFKLLIKILCQSRGGLGRNTLTNFFCQCLPSAKNSTAANLASPGDAVLGDQFAKAQAGKSKEWIWKWGRVEKGECRLTSILWTLDHFLS